MGILPEREGGDLTPLRHFLYLLSVIINAIFLGLIFFHSTPLNASTTTLTQVGAPTWGLYLVTVNETLTTNLQATFNQTLAGGGGSGDLRQFGFGVWGWCEQPNDATKNPSCVVKPFWNIPGSADSTDPVTQLGLPSAIANSLSPTGFLLLFPFLQQIALGILLACSFGKPYKIGKVPFYMAPSFAVPSTIFGFCLSLPVFVVAVVGANSVPTGLQGNLGHGMVVLIVGGSIESLFGGLYVGYGWRKYNKENPKTTTTAIATS